MATVKSPTKKAQGGALVKAVSKLVKKAAPVVKKELSIYQKMRLAKGKPVTGFNMDEQRASASLNKAIKNRTNPEAAVKRMTKAERQAKEIEDSYKKNGGKVTSKAKDGKWIQKAVNPAHKGYCTPMTKPTCTPKRKALAKTFKAMAKKRKGK